MRIDPGSSAVSPIVGEASAQVLRGSRTAVSQASSPEDHTTLSSDRDSVGSLVRTAMQSPEVRQDKVAALQQAISNGQYVIDPEKIAAAIIDDHA